MSLRRSSSAGHSPIIIDDSSPHHSPSLTDDGAQVLPLHNESSHGNNRHSLPRVGTNGESGRKGVNPVQFVRICFRSTTPASSIVNILWPVVPAAIVMHFARPDLHVTIFVLNYIAMVPSANLLGFAGSEFAGKLNPKVGTLVETTLSSVVEIVLFMVLLHMDKNGSFVPVIQAAILGSILANLLLCLGLCFFFGGMRRDEQVFHDVISETGSGLLLVAGFALLIPSAFYSALASSAKTSASFTLEILNRDALRISRGTAIVLLCAFVMYMWFNLRSHQNIYTAVLEEDEAKDTEERYRKKLTFIESIIATVVSLTCVTLCAVFLVQEIESIVERGVPDAFLGLILVPLVEKAAEHIGAVDDAWDDQINLALYHCLAPSIQTCFFTAPLVVIVGWGLNKSMSLNFEIFMIVCLVLAVLVVGNFLRDQKSTYLEGGLLVMVYIIIALTTWFYPNPHDVATNTQPGHAAKL